MVVVADSSFAALAFLDAVASYVTVVTRLRLDAALYTPAPPRSAHQVGRPRCKGSRLPALQHHLDDPDTPWPSLEAAYSSGHIQVSPQNLNRKAPMMSTPGDEYRHRCNRRVLGRGNHGV